MTASGWRVRLVERLQFHDGGAVSIAHPESDWRRGIVNEGAPHIGEARHGIFGDLAGLWIQAKNAIGELTDGPSLTVRVRRNVVREKFRCWRIPLLEFLGLGVKHSYLIAAVFAEPEAAFGINHAPARRRAGSRRRIERDLSGLGIDLSDILPAHHVEIEIVLRIGDHLIDIGPR